MERSEPSLIPEWLRNSGSGTGGGGSNHQFASSQLDGPLLALPKRNILSKNLSSNSDAPHSSFLDRSSSSNSRRSLSNNGFSKHDKNQYSRSYSSFNRSHRDRERGKLLIDDHWDVEYSDPLCIMTGRTDKDTLRRSQSLVARKPGDGYQKRVFSDSRSVTQSSQDSGTRAGTGMEKVTFERDFPSLGLDERPVTPDISSVPSPGLSKGAQILPIGNSALISEGRTSALAEVPTGVGGSTTASTASNVSPTSTSSSSTAGLNMAEALVLTQSRSNTAQQPSAQNQKREELAVLQSMRLIPLTSCTPKCVALNPSDKLKPKTAVKSGEPVVAPKNGLHVPSSQHGNQILRGGNSKAEVSKTTLTGKLLVLRPGRENGVSPPLKDASSPVSSPHNRTANGQGGGVSSGASVASKTLSNSKVTNPTKAVDKKLSSAQVRSRNDFFNLMRKKSLNSSAEAELKPVISYAVGQSDGLKEVASEPESFEKNDAEKCNGDTCTVSKTPDNDLTSNAALCPDEKEAAFLRSLGWEENADDEGLTEEEINAFLLKYTQLRPASTLCRSLQTRMLGQTEPQAACTSAASSESGRPNTSV